MARPIITMLTDFGERDTFVGQMKGVLLSHCPDAAIVDLTHHVEPQSIVEGALHLAAAWTSFPAGSIHLNVVDPGVGTSRRPLALRFRNHVFVLPDNGLISAVLGDAWPELVVEIDVSRMERSEISRTFHGRDVFAPAAARVASGEELLNLGTPVEPSDLARLEIPAPRETDGALQGQILLIDHFGNAITNVPRKTLERSPSVSRVVAGGFAVFRVSSTYQDVEPGEPVALVSSMGTLELAVRNGSAAGEFGLQSGTPVVVDVLR